MDEICPLVGAKLTLHLRLRTLAGRTGFQPHGQEDGRNSTRIRLFFAYTDSMAFGMQDHKLFVVQCKRCRRDVPAGVPEFPFQSIVVACPLCGEQRRYLPSEVFLGWPNHLVDVYKRQEKRETVPVRYELLLNSHQSREEQYATLCLLYTSLH